MRALFATYLVVIGLGLVYAISLGVLHR